MASARLDPWPEDRMEMMVAQACAILANAHRAKDADPYSVKDFVPDYVSSEEEKADEHARHMKAKMQALELKQRLMGG